MGTELGRASVGPRLSGFMGNPLSNGPVLAISPSKHPWCPRMALCALETEVAKMVFLIDDSWMPLLQGTFWKARYLLWPVLSTLLPSRAQESGTGRSWQVRGHHRIEW